MDNSQKELQSFHEDTQYFESHRDELLAEYPEQWIAILDQEVIGVAPEFDVLLSDIEAKGIPASKVLIEHMTQDDTVWVLPS